MVGHGRDRRVIAKTKEMVTNYACFCSAAMLTSKIITEYLENHSDFSVYGNRCYKFFVVDPDNPLKLQRILLWKGTSAPVAPFWKRRRATPPSCPILRPWETANFIRNHEYPDLNNSGNSKFLLGKRWKSCVILIYPDSAKIRSNRIYCNLQQIYCSDKKEINLLRKRYGVIYRRLLLTTSAFYHNGSMFSV